MPAAVLDWSFLGFIRLPMGKPVGAPRSGTSAVTPGHRKAPEGSPAVASGRSRRWESSLGPELDSARRARLAMQDELASDAVPPEAIANAVLVLSEIVLALCAVGSPSIAPAGHPKVGSCCVCC